MRRPVIALTGISSTDAHHRLMVTSIPSSDTSHRLIAIFRASVPFVRSHCRASIFRIVAGPNSTMAIVVMLFCCDRTGAHSTDFSVTGNVVLVAVAAPEGTTTGTGSVVVRGRWAVSLLAFVVPSEEDLYRCGDEEEDAGRSLAREFR